MSMARALPVDNVGSKEGGRSARRLLDTVLVLPRGMTLGVVEAGALLAAIAEGVWEASGVGRGGIDAGSGSGSGGAGAATMLCASIDSAS